jgi:hypothetical protein
MNAHDAERLAELIATLPPAPEGWVRAAQELPAARREMDELVERAEADEEFRRQVIADLEGALRESGHEPDPLRVAALRARLLPDE